MTIFANRKMGNSFFSPPIFFLIVVMGNILIGIITIDYQYEYSGILYLSACSLIIFFINAPLLNILRNRHTIFNVNKKIDNRVQHRSTIFIILIFVLAMMSPLYSVIQNGFSISSLFNFQELLSYNAEVAKARYTGQIETKGFISTLFLIFMYAAPMIGGTHLGLFKKRKSIALITLIPPIVTVLVSNTKAGMLAAVITFIAGWIIGQTIRNGHPKFRVRSMLKICVAFIILGLFLFFAMLLRVGNFSSSTISSIWQKFIVYAFGDVPAFDSWFSSYYSQTLGMGKNLFVGVYSFLGLTDRVQGLYTDFVYLPSGFGTNVYSAYRAMIMDFSTIGGFIFLLFFSTFATLAFCRISEKRGLVMNGFILMNFYFFVMYSKFTSIWTYTSYIFALFLYALYLLLIKYQKNNLKGTLNDY
ncbi:O-antigen polymerase [Oenococcus oeni]|nr:O-antigen polymerase [Oenococcus oeni]